MTPEEREHLHAIVRQAVRDGVIQALNEVVRDDSEFGRLTEKLYDRMQDHAARGISQWVGKRIMMILMAAALSASVAWAVMTGKIK